MYTAWLKASGILKAQELITKLCLLNLNQITTITNTNN
jgi:hypothetical protein